MYRIVTRCLRRVLGLPTSPRRRTPLPRTPEYADRCGADGAPRWLPPSLEIGARHLRVGDSWVASFAVAGYPRHVHPGWLHPLFTHPARVDVSLHIDPLPGPVAIDRLRRRLARLEADRRHTARHDRLAEPHIDLAAADAHDLTERLTRGEGRLFRVGLYLTVHAPTEAQLADDITALRSLTDSMLLDTHPTTWRALAGWTAALPLGVDPLDHTRTFDTDALAAAFPFTNPDIPTTARTARPGGAGVLYGHNLASPTLVHHDRFALDNHNALILGRSGAGKSYLAKLDVLRSLYQGVEVAVLDPDDEYRRLSAAVGGAHLDLGAPGVHLNPLDLCAADPTQRGLFLHTLIDTLLRAPLTAQERALLDQAITATYRASGITADPHTWTRPAPLLPDLARTLHRSNALGRDLAARLHPYTDGAHSRLFTGPTTTAPRGHLVVLSLRAVADESRPAATLLALDTLWRTTTSTTAHPTAGHPATADPTGRGPIPPRPRQIVIDEAWQLLADPAGATFLRRMAKSARKQWAGLTFATQDVADLLATDLGTSIAANCATQILLRQAPQTIDHLTRAFHLTEGERQFLLTASTGQALLGTGAHLVAFQALASPTEHDLITTAPADLHDLHDLATSGDRTDDEFPDTGDPRGLRSPQVPLW